MVVEYHGASNYLMIFRVCMSIFVVLFVFADHFYSACVCVLLTNGHFRVVGSSL